MSPKTPLKRITLTPQQRYLLSLLNIDGELFIKERFRILRVNGAQAGYIKSAQALVRHGFARHSTETGALLRTPQGQAYLSEEHATNQQHK